MILEFLKQTKYFFQRKSIFPGLEYFYKKHIYGIWSCLMLIFLCSALIGSMIFFTAVVSPSAFSSLGSEESSKFLRTIFPRMFLFGAILSLLIGIVAVITNSHVLVIVGFFCFILFGFNRNYLTPRINVSKDNNQRNKFRILHFWSVALFLLVLILMLGAVIWLQNMPSNSLG